MSTDTGTFKPEIRSLSPEILLEIFLNLDSHETVILRSVCKEFLEIIDNNKSLWRVLVWIQEKDESALQAVEKFDQKSASTLKEVSIFQAEGEVDNERLLEVLDRSKSTLTDLSLKVYDYELTLRLKIVGLASSSPLLKSLVLWPSDEYPSVLFPKTRLTRCSRHFSLNLEKSSDLQVLWWWNAVKDWNGKLDVSSLISFADPAFRTSDQVRSFLINFSATLVHLSINTYTNGILPSLFCPSLRVLEGRFSPGFPPWLNAPSLQIVIAGNVGSFIGDLPVSVQELWLLSGVNSSASAKLWDFLPLVCPKLTVIKLARDYCKEAFVMRESLEAVRLRQSKVNEGVEIGGIKMRSLEKLIVPTELLEPDQLGGLREIVNEVIDIKDYPDFIELKS